MTRNEFIEMIKCGGDIMFDCDGRSFTILVWTDCPIYIAEQVTENFEAKFDTAEELLTGYMINGLPLEQRLEQVKVTYRT